MNSRYYLLSQLPSLDGLGENTPLPVKWEDFLALCTQFLGKREAGAVADLTLLPPREDEKSASALATRWSRRERQLRLALAQVRAKRMGKTFAAEELPAELTALAAAAVELPDPLEAERLLQRARLDFLETLRPSDPFSSDAVFYYGLKLKLSERLRGFDRAAGEAAYQAIYQAVMEQERLEKQQ